MKQKTKSTQQKEKIEIKTMDFKPIKIQRLKVHIIGKTPYLPEPMDMQMLDKYDKKKSNQTYDKDIESEEEKVKKKFYYTKDGKFGIPSRCFYQSMIRASSYLFDKQDGGMRNVREGIVVLGDIIPMKYKSKEVVCHWGRTSGMSKSPRKILRNQFNDWSVDLDIEFNSSQLSGPQIINILNWAGFHIGVGAFRKEKTGNYGLFTVKV